MKKKSVIAIVVTAIILISSGYMIFKSSKDKKSEGSHIVADEKDKNVDSKNMDNKNGENNKNTKDKDEEKSSNEEKDKSNDAGSDEKSKSSDIPENPSKNFSYVEQMVLNYKILFEGAASDKEVSLENIEAVVDKNSDFYLKIREELEYYRKSTKDFSFKDFYLEDITYDKSSNLYEAHVKESITFKVDGVESSKDKKGIYKIRLDKNNSSIVNYVTQ